MREIKFRVWDRDFEKMRICGDDQHDSMIFVWNQACYFNQQNGCGSSPDGKGTYHLMQYTGLKDKNGKEIYEEDILKARKSISDETEVYFRVKYTGAAFALVHPEYHNTIYMEVMPWYVRETAEIIGNIYENPFLLEESK
ncbi:YopX family protein [Heyndrickxia oleronia]|uniref:YopX family protein n=1 Tax=Heyndrickxia oleronia TaxID=38875 RepID=A0AAW6STH9_9BACI|nr:YopX family protein [Heyndrickxia oleronia]MDH5161488.1 YopX family protein [Heyndrickxia oleronia]